MNNRFKSILLALFIGFSAGCAAAYAGTPKQIAYQGTLRKAGTIYTGTVSMEFRITNADGSVVYWTSGSTAVYVSAGLFRYPLGVPNEAQFAAIPWAAGAPYVRVILDGAALPAEQLLSTPYALHAGTAEGRPAGLRWRTGTCGSLPLRVTAVSSSRTVLCSIPRRPAAYG